MDLQDRVLELLTKGMTNGERLQRALKSEGYEKANLAQGAFYSLISDMGYTVDLSTHEVSL